MSKLQKLAFIATLVLSFDAQAQWTTNGTNINNTNTGNVGVGTTNPQALLDISAGNNNQHIRISQKNSYHNSSSGYLYPALSYHAWKDNYLQNVTSQISFYDRPGTYGYPEAVRTSDIYFQTAHNWNGAAYGQYLNNTMVIKATQDGGYVGIGTTNPEVNLQVVGRAKITDSRNNTFIGGGNTNVLANTNPEHGRRNVAIGNLASPNLSTGSSNVSVGYEAGVNLTTGNNNFSFGSGSLFNTTTGDGNVAIGTVAMFGNVTGGENVGIGQGALNNANGFHNTAIGFGAGPLLTNGIYNTFIGNRAGDQLETGNNNTIIGSRIDLLGKGIISAQNKTLSNTVIIADGDGQIRFFSDAAGNVGIGTTTPGAYKLAVKGDAIFTKVKVSASSSTWPDYVFHHSYKLPTLQEVEAFIKTNKHLPGVPSAKEVEKEGLDVGDNQAVLLKKIEELTLYVIQQQKEIEALKAKIK